MTHLRSTIIALADAEVNFIIGGGVACVLHGVERFTLDLDLSVNLTVDNLERFISVMKTQELIPRVPVPPESLLSPETRKMMIEEKNALVFTFIDLNDPRRHVDVFLRDDLSYDSLINHADIVELDGRRIKIVNIAKMLEIKRAVNPPRDKDILDIKALKRLLEDG